MGHHQTCIYENMWKKLYNAILPVLYTYVKEEGSFWRLYEQLYSFCHLFLHV